MALQGCGCYGRVENLGKSTPAYLVQEAVCGSGTSKFEPPSLPIPSPALLFTDH